MHGDAGPASGGGCLPSGPQPIQGTLGGVFFGIVEVLAIVPISCCKSLTLDCDLAGPSCSTACNTKKPLVSGTQSKRNRIFNMRHTSTIRYDLEGGGHEMGIAASLCVARQSGSGEVRR